jgi:hypothetical protein
MVSVFRKARGRFRTFVLPTLCLQSRLNFATFRLAKTVSLCKIAVLQTTVSLLRSLAATRTGNRHVLLHFPPLWSKPTEPTEALSGCAYAQADRRWRMGNTCAHIKQDLRGSGMADRISELWRCVAVVAVALEWSENIC